ncbi:FAD-binding oxidoreductase [Actinoplanes sp. N902-109]|uniref:FAD-binding oxidoreductase n=1 Tax=Actinoplanes sp. (strain N902-109) TaxID=649831 RepID=UPI0003295310|nr:FAD-binding protein [Actinoplanes sp. N902-109]AGL13739.1 secreted FAD-binding protein [Actinoplanes sp. N902-109]
MANPLPYADAAPARPRSRTGAAAAFAVGPDDPRYAFLVGRGINRRLTTKPAVVYTPAGTEQVRRAVAAALADGQRIAVRSGGHCIEALVDNADVAALIDLSRLRQVTWDPVHRAFSVGGGALLRDVYRELFLGHGVAVPGGTCPTVGVGGYVLGGGFGARSRRHGLVVDHLYGVEVVVTDGAGRVRRVVATRDTDDPHHDLWWAHTGAGGGSFGVVTRFLFRSPDASGADPSRALPRPAARSLVATVRWPWETLTEPAFTRLVTNYGAWHAEHSGVDTPFADLNSSLVLSCRAAGQVTLVCEIHGDGAEQMLDSYLSAVTAGLTVPHTRDVRSLPWLDAVYAELYTTMSPIFNRYKGKGAYLRRPYDAEQIAIAYRYLSDPAYTGRAAINLLAYGGAINAVDPAATAVAQRDSILKSYVGTAWSAADPDEQHLTWLRHFYRDLHAATGGVPMPSSATDGSYINYPDTDLANPVWNSSGVPWHALYFKGNYARLQQIKARYDPADRFRHPLSVQLPGQSEDQA